MTRAMYMSKLYAPTLKEDPADAELASHRLLLRAGMIRKEAARPVFLPAACLALDSQDREHRARRDGRCGRSGGHDAHYGATPSCGVSPAVSSPMARSLCALTTVMVASSCWAPPTRRPSRALVRNELRSYKQLWSICTTFRTSSAMSSVPALA